LFYISNISPLKATQKALSLEGDLQIAPTTGRKITDYPR